MSEPNGHQYIALRIPTGDHWNLSQFSTIMQSIPKKQWKGFGYNILWYGKQLPWHSFKKVLLQKLTWRFTDKYLLPTHETYRTIAIKDCPEKFLKRLMSIEKVQLLENMPEKFKPF